MHERDFRLLTSHGIAEDWPISYQDLEPNYTAAERMLPRHAELALLHREFYVEKDFAKADWALEEANKRLDSLDKGESPWNKATGTAMVKRSLASSRFLNWPPHLIV